MATKIFSLPSSIKSFSKMNREGCAFMFQLSTDLDSKLYSSDQVRLSFD